MSGRGRVTTCSSNEYRCLEGICISIDKRCNGYADCRNGDDEDSCAMMDILILILMHISLTSSKTLNVHYSCQAGNFGQCQHIVDLTISIAKMETVFPIVLYAMEFKTAEMVLMKEIVHGVYKHLTVGSAMKNN
ncbi:hypothetical protein TSAR_001301 [Trichomalopsis sarcophagae]|uniref:Uncharacterized protein n=1 Tax=Trichomalopsis sarcophagae TaxID=543379 RepID=A0A232FJV5_9HYME|nr:hypothetical protein TSAR_001301 [Trichomalopsis sarcophagae]